MSIESEILKELRAIHAILLRQEMARAQQEIGVLATAKETDRLRTVLTYKAQLLKGYNAIPEETTAHDKAATPLSVNSAELSQTKQVILVHSGTGPIPPAPCSGRSGK